MNNTKKLLQFIIILILAQAACNIPTEPTPTLVPEEQTRRAILATLNAPSLTPTITPTATITLTPIPIPATPTPICDVAEYVQDVTLPDNTVLKPGEQTTKTWRLKNIGACTWTTEYAIVFVNGDKLGTNDSYALPGNVPPGETVDITVPITAPNTNGTYKGNWLLRNANGQKFGLNGAVDRPFWVSIKVTDAVYDFVENACLAKWVGSGASTGVALGCPGKETDNQGFVIRFLSDKVRAEDNKEYINSLLMSPYWSDNGVISGAYPAFKIENGYHLKAQIGCRYKEGLSNCNVRFQVNYLMPDEKLFNLKEADQIADGQLADLDLDLSMLAGQSVRFVLTIITNGTSNDDFAIWVAPRIVR